MTNRIATWHNVGTDVTNCTSTEEILEKAGINEIITTEPITTASGIIIPDNVATVYPDGTPIGIVSEKYEVVQNSEAFSFLDYLDATPVKAGRTNTGLNFVIAEMGESKILGDEFKLYTCLENSFNGKYPIGAVLTPLRIVCQNQFPAVFSKRNTNNIIRIRHSSEASWRIEAAKSIMAEQAKTIELLGKEAEKYANIHMSEIQFTKIVRDLFPIDENMTERQKNTMLKRRTQLISEFNAEDVANHRNNMWGAVLAFTGYTTHSETKQTKNADENKFMAVTLNPQFAQFLSILEARAVA